MFSIVFILAGDAQAESNVISYLSSLYTGLTSGNTYSSQISVVFRAQGF